MRYPLVKPGVVYQDMRDAVARIHNCGLLSWRNPVVGEFEEVFARYIGTKHAIAVSSGTAALHLAYDVAVMERCTIPACAYVAVQNAALYLGVMPQVEDVSPRTWNLDKLPEFRSVVVPVHTLGNPCDMDRLRCMSTTIIEDACEALGGTWKGRKLGSVGDIGVFSFFGNKVITAGEGGMVVTDDDDYAAEIRLLANQAQVGDYEHDGIGYNYRMTAFQAAVLLPQVGRIDDLVAGRQKALARYHHHLGERMQQSLPGGTHAAWMAGVSGFTDAAKAVPLLALQGIETRRIFTPLGRGPVADYLRRSALMFPLWADMTNDDVDYICGKIEVTT